MALIDCYECSEKVSEFAIACPKCGALRGNSQYSTPVKVLDVDMAFGTMVWFMIKVAIAAIPAALALAAIFGILSAVFIGMRH